MSKIYFPDYLKAKVLVLGDIMLDRYWHGGTSRISPEAPVPVVKVNNIEDRPGGAANVALNVASLGGAVSLMGLTGEDESAAILETLLTEKAVECLFQKIPQHPTITKLRVLSQHQQLIRLDFEESFNQGELHSQLIERFQNSLEGMGAIVLSDYAKGALQEVTQLISIANQKNIPVLVDPKGAEFEKYRGATLVTPNLSEFEAVVGRCNNDNQTIVERGEVLRDSMQWHALLVTRGEHGMTLLEKGCPPIHLSAQAREVFDVTGAGDTVIGTLAASIAAGGDLASATTLANTAAGIVVGKLGTATATMAELRRAFMGLSNSDRGVLSKEELMIRIADARAHGEKLVMTNGCFDILHPGHVAYLEQARELGDRLIVAVNSDDSVKRLKGKNRPINPLQHRMAVLAGLAAVDWVVPFEEDTPAQLIAKVIPDILVKGGDYTVEQIAGADTVMNSGGKVEILPFREGLSTTRIIQTITANESREEQDQ